MTLVLPNHFLLGSTRATSPDFTELWYSAAWIIFPCLFRTALPPLYICSRFTVALVRMREPTATLLGRSTLALFGFLVLLRDDDDFLSPSLFIFLTLPIVDYFFFFIYLFCLFVVCLFVCWFVRRRLYLYWSVE